MSTTDSMRFVCAACNFRARIPASYHGKVILCPGCQQMQVAHPDAGDTTGDTVRYVRVSTAQTDRVNKTDSAGRINFTCTSCFFQAKLAPNYAGKAIACPQCKAAQVIPA
jgi:hypothetical protein